MSGFTEGLAAHRELFNRLHGLQPDVERGAALIATALLQGGKLLLMGNGGSAADCQHLAAEFTGRFRQERRPLAALALTTDTSALTCVGNDYGFEHVFARQLEALARPGDCVVGISTSGRSPNVLRALLKARELGLSRIGLTGRDGGDMLPLCDLNIVVPHHDTARIQEAHIFIGHSWCEMVEDAVVKGS